MSREKAEVTVSRNVDSGEQEGLKTILWGMNRTFRAGGRWKAIHVGENGSVLMLAHMTQNILSRFKLFPLQVLTV